MFLFGYEHMRPPFRNHLPRVVRDGTMAGSFCRCNSPVEVCADIIPNYLEKRGTCRVPCHTGHWDSSLDFLGKQHPAAMKDEGKAVEGDGRVRVSWFVARGS